MPRKRTPLAIVYDFDGTLARGNVQEPQFIPELGMKPDEFWAEVRSLAKLNQADLILMYMHLMLKKAGEKNVPVRRSDFKKHGGKVVFFEGVQDWFDRIDTYSLSQGVGPKHYIVSSGNAEIIESTPIAAKFEKVYASKFMFDHNDVAIWPALAVNYTNKTQYLFRINKGAHDLSDDNTINKFVEMKDRPVPFENMIYIGDGLTDVPCFRLVKDMGGLSIAVFQPRTKEARSRAYQLKKEGRVHSVASADYTESSELSQVVKAQIDFVAAREKRNKILAKAKILR